MGSDGGSSALLTAVDTFVGYFDNVNDHVAMVSFASNVTANVSLTTGFQTPIKNAVKSLSFTGATYALGGLLEAQTQNNSFTVPAGQNAAKVVVFFTDGFANTIEDNLSCPGYPLVNYGGNAPTEGTTIAFMDPASGNILSGSGGKGQCTISDGGKPSCCSATKFPSQQYGTQESFTRANITNESEYRMLQLANTMRSATPIPTTIYTIGLGTDIDTNFMQQLANDPTSSSYNSAMPAGLFLQVPSCPSSTCTTDLQQAFQVIASNILLRLTK
jgi:hypothetical protein